MSQREITGNNDYDVSVVTEQMADSRWAVAAAVVQSTDSARQVTPLAMSHERFASEAEAREAGLPAGREWIERNTLSGMRAEAHQQSSIWRMGCCAE